MPEQAMSTFPEEVADRSPVKVMVDISGFLPIEAAKRLASSMSIPTSSLFCIKLNGSIIPVTPIRKTPFLPFSGRSGSRVSFVLLSQRSRISSYTPFLCISFRKILNCSGRTWSSRLNIIPISSVKTSFWRISNSGLFSTIFLAK